MKSVEELPDPLRGLLLCLLETDGVFEYWKRKRDAMLADDDAALDDEVVGEASESDARIHKLDDMAARDALRLKTYIEACSDPMGFEARLSALPWSEQELILIELDNTRVESLTDKTRPQMSAEWLEDLHVRQMLEAHKHGVTLFDDSSFWGGLASFCPLPVAVRLADRLAGSGNEDDALRAYDGALGLSTAFTTQCTAEVAYIVALRAGTRTPIFDGLAWYHIADRALEIPVLSSPSTRGKLVRLALAGYAKAFVSLCVSEHEDADDIQLMLLVLDGLRIVLLELDLIEAVEQTGNAFEYWNSEFEPDTYESIDVELERRFARTAGILEERGPKRAYSPSISTIASPEEIDALLETMEPRVADLANRRLEVALRETYAALSDRVRGRLQVAEQSFLRERQALDMSGCVVLYRRALEALVAELEGRSHKEILGEYGDSTKLKLSKYLKRDTVELTRMIREFTSQYGKPAAHEDERRPGPVLRVRAERARQLALQIIDGVTRWRKSGQRAAPDSKHAR